MQEFDHIPIDILNLPKRIFHALARGGILTVGNLRDFYQNKNKYHVRNFGEKSFNEISKVLEELPNNPLVLGYRKKDSVQLSFHNAKWREGTSQTPIDVQAVQFERFNQGEQIDCPFAEKYLKS